MVEAGHDNVERLHRDRWVAAIGIELILVALEFLQQIGLQVSPRSDIHDLEDRGEGEVMIDWRVASHQLPEAIEQVLEPQHRANALVDWVLVEHETELP